MQIMAVPNAIEGSWDKLLHYINDANDTLLVFKASNGQDSKKYESTSEGTRRGQRAIGVVYHHMEITFPLIWKSVTTHSYT
jgi:hypothetical protein